MELSEIADVLIKKARVETEIAIITMLEKHAKIQCKKNPTFEDKVKFVERCKAKGYNIRVDSWDNTYLISLYKNDKLRDKKIIKIIG